MPSITLCRLPVAMVAMALLAVLPLKSMAHERVEELVGQVRESVVNVSSVYYQREALGRSSQSVNPQDFFRRFIPREFQPFFPSPQDPGEGDGWDGEEAPDEPQESEESDEREYRGPKSRSEGSGFIISRDGYIVTSFHVVDGADEVRVTLQDRRELEAEIIGLDRATDLALLHIEANDLPAAQLGNSDQLRVGQSVMAIGSPFRLDFSVTVGVVSALSRAVEGRDTGRYVPFIQSDVAINPGNSGGPLYNMDGEVVGVNAQIFTRTGGFMGLSFSVPINTVKSVVDQLRDRGKVARGWLGIGIQDVDQDLAESLSLPNPSGALVTQILKDSPATRSDIQPGDVIVSFAGKEVIYARDLPPAVGAVTPGKKATTIIYRDGKRKRIQVEIGSVPEEEEPVASERAEKVEPSVKSFRSSRLGMEVQELTRKEKQEANLKAGLKITSLKSRGEAQRVGLRNGDYLVSINGKQIKDIGTFQKLEEDLPKGRPAWVQVRRGDRAIIVTLRP